MNIRELIDKDLRLSKFEAGLRVKETNVLNRKRTSIYAKRKTTEQYFGRIITVPKYI